MSESIKARDAVVCENIAFLRSDWNISLFVTHSKNINVCSGGARVLYMGGQGVAKANSGGPWTMTENQCITPTWHKKSMNKSYDYWLLHITPC